MTKDKFMVGDRVRVIEKPSKMAHAGKEGVVASGTIIASVNPPDYRVWFSHTDKSIMLESDLVLVRRPTAADPATHLGGA